MENDLDKIFNKANAIALDSSEKEKIRGYLMSHAKKNAASMSKRGFSIFSLMTSPAFISGFLIFSMFGISFASEKALPGDILYSVKVGVNEEVKVRTAFSNEKRLDVLVALAEKRIEETEKLASEGKLNAKAQAKIESNFKKNTDNIVKNLEEVNKAGNLSVAADVTSRLEVSLDAHENILSKLAERKPESKEHIDSVLIKVKSVSKSAKIARQGYENEAIEKRNGRLEQARAVRLKVSQRSLDEAKALLESSDEIDPEVRARAEEYIAQAELIIKQAAEEETATTTEDSNAKLSAISMSLSAANPDPLIMLQEAVKLSNQAVQMLKAEARLNVKVLEFEHENEVD